MDKMFQWNRNLHLLNKPPEYLCFMAHVEYSGLPSFSKFRLFSASWSAFLWYSVKRCCSMILSFSSKDTLLSAFFLMFACETEWQGKCHFSWSFLIKLLLAYLENNARSSEKEWAFNLFIQFLHDLFKLGVCCPEKNTIWEIRISLPQSLSNSLFSCSKTTNFFRFCQIINFVSCIVQLLNCRKMKN